MNTYNRTTHQPRVIMIIQQYFRSDWQTVWWNPRSIVLQIRTQETDTISFRPDEQNAQHLR